MTYIEEWPSRFVAYHKSATIPGDTVKSPLDEIFDTLTEGHRRAKEMTRAAESKYGARLMWIEIEALERSGDWSPVGRFYPEGFQQG
ncbi:MAG: hypothetical protein ABID84_02825 [Chloroflexota bacterium]